MNIKNFQATGYTCEMDEELNGFQIVASCGFDGQKKLTRFDGQVRKSGMSVFEFTSTFVRRPEDEESRLVFQLRELADTTLGGDALATLTECRDAIVERVAEL